jgi:hypothetical protein
MQVLLVVASTLVVTQALNCCLVWEGGTRLILSLFCGYYEERDTIHYS